MCKPRWDEFIAAEVSSFKSLLLGQIKRIDNEAITCPHSKLNPATMNKTVSVPETIFNGIKELDVDFDPVLCASTDFCQECCDRFADKKQRIQDHHGDVNLVKAARKESSVMYYISKAWWDSTRSNPGWKKKKTEFPNNEIPRPDDAVYAADVFCSHGELDIHEFKRIAVSQDIYDIICNRFSGFSTISTEKVECMECMESRATELVDMDDHVDQAATEKGMFKRLLQRNRRIYANKAYRALPIEFYNAWVAYVSAPLTQPKPKEIDLSLLYCTHGLLRYDVSTDNIKEQYWTYALDTEWDYLALVYPVIGTPLEVQKSKNDLKYELFTDIPVCDACRLERLLEYTEATITVEKHGDIADMTETRSNPDDAYVVSAIVGHRTDAFGQPEYRVRWDGYGSDEDTWEPPSSFSDASLIKTYHKKVGPKKRDRQQIVNVDEYAPPSKPDKPDKQLVIDIDAVAIVEPEQKRESTTPELVDLVSIPQTRKRTRVSMAESPPDSPKSGSRSKRQRSSVVEQVITPELTVHELMLKVFPLTQLNETFGIPPLYQRLVYNDRELAPEETMKQAGIYHGQVLKMMVFDQSACKFDFTG
jgi:hypothetical protein